MPAFIPNYRSGVKGQIAQPQLDPVRALSVKTCCREQKRGRCLAAERPVPNYSVDACPMSPGLLALAALLPQRITSALQVRASRVRFNLTLIPERFSPQKLTQVEQLSLWPPIEQQTTRPPVHFALLPGLSASHRASCDETILRCRAGGCGMTDKSR